MPDQTPNTETQTIITELDKLKSEYEKIKLDLEELKEQLKSNTTGNIEKQAAKLEELNKQATDKEKQIEDKIAEAKQQVNNNEIMEKAEEIVKFLEEEKQIVSNLKKEIKESLDSSNTETEATSSESDQSTKDKNWFQKTCGWIGDQWNDVWDKEKWKDDKLKNILRTLGFTASIAGIPALLYKGIKNLFTRKKKNRNRKPFWKTTRGNILKWFGIGFATGGGIHFLGKKINFGKNKNRDTKDNGNIEGGSLEKAKVNNSGDKYEIDKFNITISPEFKEIWDNLKGEEKPELEPFACAMKAYKEEKEKGHLKNTEYLTIIDFTKNMQTQNRFFVINLNTNTVEYAEKCGHGINSGDKEWTTSFSNKRGSLQSSLGASITPSSSHSNKKGTWHGSFIIGQENSNNNASRGIAIHPVRSLLNKFGKSTSEGCFTIPTSQKHVDEILQKINGGSLVFAYAKSEQYFTQSKYFKKEGENFVA